MLKVRPKETASMLTRDRVRLDADIYRPDAEGDFGGATDAAALRESDRIYCRLCPSQLVRRSRLHCGDSRRTMTRLVLRLII